MNSVNQRLPAPSGAMVAMQNLRLRSPMALHGEGANSWIGPPLVGTSPMRLAGPSPTPRVPSAPPPRPRPRAPFVAGPPPPPDPPPPPPPFPPTPPPPPPP